MPHHCRTRSKTATGTSSSSEMEDPKNEVKIKFEDTLRRLAMEVEQQNLSKIMPAISSVEDFLQVFHELSSDMTKKSAKSDIAKLKNKKVKSYLEEIHEKAMDNLERCHEERMTVIKKLPKRIVSLLKYNTNGLVGAVTEDTIANFMILKEEIAAECGDPWLATEDEKKERHWRLRAFLRQVSAEAHVVSECRYRLRTRKRIKSVEDFLVEDHERLMAFTEKSHKKVISNARKKGKVLLQMVGVMGHEDRTAMLERDHEERMAMIQKLPKTILSKLENKVEGLMMAIGEDISDHLERHSKEIRVKGQKMLDAECACRNIG